MKKNEMDIRKLRQQISDLEETLSHAGKDKAQNEEKRRELEEARARMGGLESQSEQLAAELAQRQLDVEQLRQEMARGAALLAEKQRELARLQEREADNAGLMEKQAAETVGGEGVSLFSPLFLTVFFLLTEHAALKSGVLLVSSRGNGDGSGRTRVEACV